MAGNQYELRIVIDEGGGTSSQIAGSSSSGGNETTAMPVKSQASLATFVATRAIKPFISQAKNYLVNNVELMTGSTELQQRVDFAMQAIDAGASVISTTAAGAALGGPIGGAVGFVVGIVQQLTGYFFEQQQINLERRSENRQISYLQDRAGPAFNMSRRGN